MTLYSIFKKRPSSFFRLFGVTLSNFERILVQLKEVYLVKIVGKYKRLGRPTKLDLCDQLLLILLYYRSNLTYFFLSGFFRLNASQIGRAIHRLEPLLLSIVKLEKSHKISEEEACNLLIDATEQVISRPKKFQKKYYSGKKKSHTLKTQLVTTARGRILSVSRPYAGKNHDFNICKSEINKLYSIVESKNEEEFKIYADSGYLGLQKYLKNYVILPKKKTKYKPLNPEEKIINRKNSKIRVKIEHIFAQIKKFKILSNKYRGKIARYGLRTAIICGLVNVHNGFSQLPTTLVNL